jgi:hypothetical protein
MADTFRALCAELTDRLEHAITSVNADSYYRENRDAVDRARTALEAQPEPQGPMPEVDDILHLAAIICRVDGNHDKGAAALAEAILSHPDSRWQHAQPEPETSRLRYCDVHGQQPENAWGCPECVREMRHQLAQPEPQGLTDEEPTDQEIEEWADAAAEVPLEEMDPEVHGWRRCFKSDEFSDTIRAALRRWGRPAIEPVPEVEGADA